MGIKSLKKDSTIRIVASVTVLNGMIAFARTICYVEQTETFYKYEINSPGVVDNMYYIATAVAGTTRWRGISGKYNTNALPGSDMYIYLTETDFTTNRFFIPTAYGQTYVVDINTAGAFYIALPTNIGNEGKEINLFVRNLDEELFITDHQDDDVAYTMNTGAFFTFHATSLSSPRWMTYFNQNHNTGALGLKTLRLNYAAEPEAGYGERFVCDGSVMLSATNATASTTLGDHFSLYVNNFANATITLPGVALGGRIYVIKKYSDNEFPVTVTRGGAYLIDGIYTSITLAKRNDYVMIQAFSASRWQVISTNVTSIYPSNVLTVTAGDPTISKNVDIVLCTINTEVYLPLISTVHTGKTITIKRTGTGYVSVDGNGTLIDGITTHGLHAQHDSITVQAVNGVWRIVAKQETGGDAWNPTLTPLTNISALTSVPNPSWMRVGKILRVEGRVNIQATAIGPIAFRISPPVIYEDLSTESSGTITELTTGARGYISADQVNNVLQVNANALDTTNRVWYYTCQYLIG